MGTPGLEQNTVGMLLPFRRRLVGEEGASSRKTADSSRDIAALRNDNLQRRSTCTSNELWVW